MSDDEELLYGLLGTQFNTDADEETEFKRSKLKRKAAEEEVVDAKGRATRFHGAFTGGFSAGYYNTVGSKEGFQPSEFISQGRATVRNYRPSKPEDFMDDEDFDQNGIAPKMLRTTATYDNEHIRNQLKQSLGNHDIVGDSDILKDILVPQSLTIGFKLLLNLGYLASRGIGDKSHPINDDQESSGKTKFDYEPEETFQLSAKTDKFGLGYSGMRRELISVERPKETRGVNFGLRGKKGIRGVAFGGVEEEDDGGDIGDVFGQESMAAYHYEVVEDEDKVENFGWTAPRNIKKSIMPSGSICGFHLGTSITKPERKIYAPPELPRFYLPIFPIKRRQEENARAPSNHVRREERPRLMPALEVPRARPLGNKRPSRWGEAVSGLQTKFRSAGVSTAIEDERQRRAGPISDGREEAAVAGAYGCLTRARLKWGPDPLLCRRFNVPPPFPGGRLVGLEDEGAREPIDRSEDVHEDTQVAAVEAVCEERGEAVNEGPSGEGPVEPAVPGEDLCVRAPVDLFKAVFEDPAADFSSSEEEDEPQEETVTKGRGEVPQRVAPRVEEAPQSIVASMGAALGALFGGEPSRMPPASQGPPAANQIQKKVYGPAPPPGFVFQPVLPGAPPRPDPRPLISKGLPAPSRSINVTPDCDYEYVDKTAPPSSPGKTKKQKKEKKKGKKEKKEKKKHRKRRTSSGGSS